MKKTIDIDIIKSKYVKKSPFKFIIYVLEDSTNIIIENAQKGKAIITDAHHIQNIIRLSDIKTNWIKSFDDSFIKFNNDRIYYFMPLFPEDVRFVTLTSIINSTMLPNFKIVRKTHPELGLQVAVIDNSSEDYKSTYNYLFKNIKEFETDNFKLRFKDSIKNEINKIYDENFIPIKEIEITYTVPILKLYMILSPMFSSQRYDFNNTLIVMRYKNKFYRFPYGNVNNGDWLCFGRENTELKKQSISIANFCYYQIITTIFNGDYSPLIKFNNKIQTTLDIDWINNKISKNDFELSYVDVLYYLSNCKKIEDINFQLFLLSPNVPKEILENIREEYVENC